MSPSPKQLTQTTPASSSRTNRWALFRSLVQTDAARPYTESLARASASSSVEKGTTVATGPKISSCAMLMRLLAPTNSAGPR